MICYNEPEDIDTRRIACTFARDCHNLTFNDKTQELYDLYLKYEVNPERFKENFLKRYNAKLINELEKQIETTKNNLALNEHTIAEIQSQLSNKVLRPTLFNIILHKKIYMLENQKIRLLANNEFWKDQILEYGQKIEEIKENPYVSTPAIEEELKNLGNFLDFYQLIDETKEKIRFKQVNIDDIDEKIDQKQKYIVELNKAIKNNNLSTNNANNEIQLMCAQLSKDHISLTEILENADEDIVKQLLDYYDSYIKTTIKEIL